MSALPKYDHYKASDVEWLGDVPSHWEVRSLRGILKERGETNEGTKTDFILSVMKDRGVIPYTEKGNVGNKMSEDITTYKLVCPGDLVINKMNAIIGSLGISEYHGALSKVYFVMQPRYEYLNNRFYGYLFQIRDFQKSLCKISYGIMELRESINFNEFKNLPLPLPPKPEQDRIVAFLDQKTAEIDALIAKKQRQIELLDEQKAILINRAVTRSLNPNAKLRPSGSKWIGQIPTHWEIGRLKHHCIKIVDCPHATPIYDPDGEHPAIRTADVTPGHIDLNGAKRLSKAEFSRWTERMVPRFGDILYSREGERFGIAAPVPPDSDLCISQRMMAFRPSRDVVSQFLMWQLNCQHVYLQACQDVTGSAAPHVNIGTIANYQLVLPPMVEQKEIAAFISDSDKKHRIIINKIESQIESLKTLRSTLIAHSVTGRIKV